VVALFFAMKHKSKESPCHCGAYPFPHRPYGGKCEGPEPEDENESLTAYQLERQLLGCSFQEFTNPNLRSQLFHQ
jgi:hypothetical protein